MTFMAGYGGTLLFWLDESGKPVGLEILAHWSPYTPAMVPGFVSTTPSGKR
jgi:hypothetical protein